jgi:cell division protein FtsA
MPLHIRPTLYSLDGVGGVANPVGLHADRVGVDIHVVLADQSPVRNIDMTVRAAHLDVECDCCLRPSRPGLACLSAEERELGVAMVEMGAAVTNVSVFIGGMLVGLETLNQGRVGHYRRHRLDLRHPPGRGRAPEVLPRIGD